MTFAEHDGAKSGVGTSDSSGSGKRDDGYSSRGKDVGLEEDEDDDSDGGGKEGRDDLHSSDKPRGRYSFSPEDVRFATSRECYVAMRAVLIECETVLCSVGGFGSEGGFDVSGDSNGDSPDGGLAEIIATIAVGLREFFAPMSTAAVRPTNRQGKGVSGTLDPGFAGAAGVTGAAKDLAPTGAVTEQGPKGKKGGDGDGTRGRHVQPLMSVDLFPEQVKLLLMRVLERVYLVGRAAALTASAVLAKPSSATLATSTTMMMTGTSVPSSSPSSPPSPSSTSPPPLPLTTRRRQQPHHQRRAVEIAEKPGDEAGGRPTKRGKAGTTGGGCGDDGGIARAAGEPGFATTGPRLSQSARSAPSPSLFKGDDQAEHNVFLDRRTADVPATRSGRTAVLTGGTWEASEDAEGPMSRLLATVLPVAGFASGDCLQLMSAARAWAEALRAKNRRTGDDPCRKRVSFGMWLAGAREGGERCAYRSIYYDFSRRRSTMRYKVRRC